MTPVDIYPNSHYFLDFIAIIGRPERDNMGGTFFTHEIMNPYWKLWVDNRPGKGLHGRYDFEGKFAVYFHIAAEKVSAKRYRAKITWQKESVTPKIVVSEIKRFRRQIICSN
jgi:hypothetical protein